MKRKEGEGKVKEAMLSEVDGRERKGRDKDRNDCELSWHESFARAEVNRLRGYAVEFKERSKQVSIRIVKHQ